MTDQQLLALNLDPEGPQAGELWQHYKGGRYRIVARAIKEDDLTPLVVYRSIGLGIVWCRPMADFLAVLPDGRPRFEKDLGAIDDGPMRTMRTMKSFEVVGPPRHLPPAPDLSIKHLTTHQAIDDVPGVDASGYGDTRIIEGDEP